jgi:hypothetical protein
MKLLMCEECGDIISPHRGVNNVRWCECKRHAIWWADPKRGTLCVWDSWDGPDMIARGRKYPVKPRAYVIGLTNSFLQWDGQIDADAIVEIIGHHDDTYLFKRQNSVAIRVRPGETNDTSWAKLPYGEPWSDVDRENTNNKLNKLRELRYPNLIMFKVKDGVVPVIDIGEKKLYPPEFYLDIQLPVTLNDNEILDKLFSMESMFLDRYLPNMRNNSYMSVRNGWERRQVEETDRYYYYIIMSIILDTLQVKVVINSHGDTSNVLLR